jgi:hypothetical protein
MIKLLKEYLSLLIETNLAPRHMYKPERLKTFRDKIINGEYFHHVDGRKFKIDQSNTVLVNAVSQNTLDDAGYRKAFRAGVKVTFQGEEDSTILHHPGHIKKTPEFGGTDLFAGERAQITSLKGSLSGVSGGKEIHVKYSRSTNKTKPVNDIAKGSGKSDAALTFNGVPQIHVSLKHANAPNQMMQWGGLSRFAFNSKVSQFIADIRWMESQGQLSQGVVYYRPFKDDSLKKDICYGGNVDVIVIGDDNIHLIRDANGLFEISGQHVFYYEDNEIPDEEWDPCFVAFYTGDRSDFRVDGYRLVVWPIGKITSSDVLV